MCTHSMKAPPGDAPYVPVATALVLGGKSQAFSALATSSASTVGLCDIPVEVGVFFDGTNNNMARDLHGERIAVPHRDDVTHKSTGRASAAVTAENEASTPIHRRDGRLPPNECCHSNVVRLFRSFPRGKRASGIHGFYIQGVGTPFREIGEPTESSEGKAFAKGGLARIVWGLLQVLNAVHATVANQAAVMYSDDMVGELAVAYDREVGQRRDASDLQSPVVTHQDWFAPHLAKLRAALDAKPKPHVPSVDVSVFGFSRGGAEAVAFCHLFGQLLDGGKLAGIKANIRFLGVFDVVASVGGSASVAKTLPMPGALFDGHWSWANFVDKPLPECVKKGVHLIAAHEMRMNFPVTRQVGGAMQEYLYPGAHSDVGGGYAPGEQGKGREGQASLLSQIPLAHMYLAAREAGVPLLAWSEMQVEIREDFEIDASLASAWTAYTRALNGHGGILKKHMALFYRWRAMRLSNLASTASFQAASEQDQEDLLSANQLLVGDLAALTYRQSRVQVDRRSVADRPFYGPEDRLRINQWQGIRANSHTALDEWEQFAIGHFEQAVPLPDEAARFFDDYVHDSFASFYLAGETSEYDKRKRVKEIMRKDPDDLNAFETRVRNLTLRAQAALDKRVRGESLTTEEARLADEAQYGTPYPVMKDSDAGDLIGGIDKVAVRTQTATRREGGGYILRRGYYPHSGFFIRRSIHDDELMTQPNEDGVAVNYVWSDHLAVDVPRAMVKQTAMAAATSRQAAPELIS